MSNTPQARPRSLSENERQIHDLADREFSIAKAWWMRSLLLQFAVGGCSFLGIVSTEPPVVFASTMFVLVLQGLVWLCRWRLSKSKAQANRAHRMLHIMYGLNAGVSEDEVNELIAEFSPGTKKEPVKYVSYYLFCFEKPSHAALLRCLQETGYYLIPLYAACARVFYWVVALSIVILLLAVLSVSFLAPNLPHLPLLIGKMVVVTLTFVVATDLLGLAMAYSSSSSLLQKLDSRFERLLTFGRFDTDGNIAHEIPQTMSIIIDFHAVSEQAPLILDMLHQGRRERLVELWKNRSHHKRPHSAVSSQ